MGQPCGPVIGRGYGFRMDLQGWLSGAVAAIAEWQEGFGPFETDPSMLVSDERFASAFAELAGRLRGNYPFFHPSYAGQMLKPAHPAAVAGYLAAMLINPNNHALDGGPATGQMEKEAVAALAAMFGLGAHLGHLTTSGTIANLEALYVARETHPGLGVAYSEEAHYTHARMCGVLGIEGTPVPADGAGRMDTAALDALLAGGRIGTVVATTGTTGLGAIDPVHEILAVARRHGARVHVDAAYGGFFTLLARGDDPPGTPGAPMAPGGKRQAPSRELAGQAGAGAAGQAGAGAAGQAGHADPAGQAAGAFQPSLDPAPWRAIAECDSVVVDPHKHGLQPYGCGAVLFSDPEVGRFYLHDSPYTYFTSDELHLGEISLECSRAGASAAALWLTLQLLPLTPDGLGRVLTACRRCRARLGRPDRRIRPAGALPAPRTRYRLLFPGHARRDDVRDRRRVRFDACPWHEGQPAGLPQHAAGHRGRHVPAAPRRQDRPGRRENPAQRPDETRGARLRHRTACPGRGTRRWLAGRPHGR